MKQLIALALLTAVFTACKKDKNDDSDHTEFAGTITITSPAENDTIVGGNSFVVTGTITGNMEMHGYQLQIFKTANDELVYEGSEHDHAEAFALNETITHSLTDTTALKLVVEAAGDHEGSTVTKEVHFTYIP